MSKPATPQEATIDSIATTENTELLLHLIWIDNPMPMQVAVNLHKLSTIFCASLAAYDDLSLNDKPYVPLLWMNEGSYENPDRDSQLPVIKIPADDPAIPLGLKRIVEERLGEYGEVYKWLRISVGENYQFVPVVLYEEMKPALFATEGCEEVMRAADQVIDLIGERCGTISPFFVSEWMRLMILARFGGGYIDVGDVADAMVKLPTKALVKLDKDLPICVNYVEFVGAENDIIFCKRELMRVLLARVLVQGFAQELATEFKDSATEEKLAEFLSVIKGSAGNETRKIYSSLQIASGLLEEISVQLKPKLESVNLAVLGKIFSNLDYVCAYLLIAESPEIGACYRSLGGDLAKDISSCFDLSDLSLHWIGGWKQYKEEVRKITQETINARKEGFGIQPITAAWTRSIDELLGGQVRSPELNWKKRGWTLLNRIIYDAALISDSVHPLHQYALHDLSDVQNKLALEHLSVEQLCIIGNFCKEVKGRLNSKDLVSSDENPKDFAIKDILALKEATRPALESSPPTLGVRAASASKASDDGSRGCEI